MENMLHHPSVIIRRIKHRYTHATHIHTHLSPRHRFGVHVISAHLFQRRLQLDNARLQCGAFGFEDGLGRVLFERRIGVNVYKPERDAWSVNKCA